MITKAINGENEIEVFLREPFADRAEVSDNAAKETKKTNLQKTHHKAPDKMGVLTEMESVKFNKLWLDLIENHVKISAYNGMERMTGLEGILELPKYNMLKDQIDWTTPKAIFRSFVTMPVLSATFEGAGNLIVTKDIEIIHKTGKKQMAPIVITEAKRGFGFRNNREPIVENMKLVELHEMNYSGYMYNVEMPKHGNYVCQGLLIESA